MRRKDRAVTNKQEIEEFIKECEVCRIGLNDDGKVYIVPVNFGFCFEEEQLIIYLHSGTLGKKMELLKANPSVGIEMDVRHGLKTGELACEHSYYFASVIGNGSASIVENLEEKKAGLKLLMNQLTGTTEYRFEENWLKAVAVVKIVMEDYSCKKHEK